MLSTRRFGPLAAASLLPAIMLTVAGCGGGVEEVEAAAPQVDPRYASPEALLEHGKSLLNQDPGNFEGFMALFHWENPKQQQIRVVFDSMLVPSYRFLAAVKTRFGEVPQQAGEDPLEAMRVRSTGVVSRDGQRVAATMTDEKGETQDFSLVQIGDRWWISGYTIEHDPEFMSDASAGMPFEQLLEISSKLGPIGVAIDGVTTQVKSGLYSSSDQAMVALNAAIMGEMFKIGAQEGMSGSGGRP
jgi:hypothetical protein